LAYVNHKAHIDLSVDGTAHNTSDGQGVLIVCVVRDNMADSICLLSGGVLSVPGPLVEDGALDS
jgi:hypothetical protein